MSRVVQEAASVVVRQQAGTIMEQIADLQRETLAILDMAKDAQKLTPAVMAITAARQNLEFLAKLTGELNERAQVNILVNPGWVELRGLLLEALAEHPDALEAVRRVISTGGA